jgi:uroporphyrinogen-III decarboxylase
MVTKSNRSKAAERIKKVKSAYEKAEKKTDSMLVRFAESPWTLAATLAALIIMIGLLL